MIRQIRQIGSVSRALAGSFHVKKRAKDFFTYVTIGTAGTFASWNMSKIITQPMVDEFVAMRPKTAVFQQVNKVKTSVKKTIAYNPNPDLTQSQKMTKEFFEKINPLKRTVDNKLEKQKKIVLDIMNEDKNCPYVIDRSKLAQDIVLVANKYGVDPIETACIVKKESHFFSNPNGHTGKGLMQLTSSPTKDMFQEGRDTLYHRAIEDLKKTYRNPSALYKAVQANDIVNLNVGTALYLFHLKNTHGNVYKALRLYNGSSAQNSYAKDVLCEINKYKKIYQKMENF